MGRRRIRIDNEVMAQLLKGFSGQGRIYSDVPDDLTVEGIVEPALSRPGVIDLVVQSAEYSPDYALPDHKLPIERVAWDIVLFRSYAESFLEEGGIVADYDPEDEHA